MRSQSTENGTTAPVRWGNCPHLDRKKTSSPTASQAHGQTTADHLQRKKRHDDRLRIRVGI